MGGRRHASRSDRWPQRRRAPAAVGADLPTAPRAPWPAELLAHECTPLQRVAAAGGARWPPCCARCGDRPRPPPPATRSPGCRVTAVFGAAGRATPSLRGLGAHAADGGDRAAWTGRRPRRRARCTTALHAAVDLPVFDLDLGGLLVGVRRRLRAVAGSGATARGSRLSLARAVVVDLHLGVHDGWLVGGPGSSAGDRRPALDVGARRGAPGRQLPATSELVLHEVRGLGIDRERWVVRADASTAAAAGGADVLGEVTARGAGGARAAQRRGRAGCGAASADLAGLLDLFGLTASRWPRRRRARPAAARPGRDPAWPRSRRTPTAWPPHCAPWSRRPTGSARPSHGRSARPRSASTWPRAASSARCSTAPPDLADLSVTVMTSATAEPLRLTAGALDPTLGGVRVVADLATGTGATAAIELAGPGRPASRLQLWPAPASEPVAGPGRRARCPPSASRRSPRPPSTWSRRRADRCWRRRSRSWACCRPSPRRRPAVAGAVAGPAAGVRRLVLPIGLVTDPAAWFAGLARGGNLTLGPAGVALLDALAPLVVPDRGTDPGWPLADGLSISYADDGGRLSLLLRATSRRRSAAAPAARHPRR